MGVWIETHEAIDSYNGKKVTPFVGVWIETPGAVKCLFLCYVTPFVGVWIETIVAEASVLPEFGHTLRGCVD